MRRFEITAQGLDLILDDQDRTPTGVIQLLMEAIGAIRDEGLVELLEETAPTTQALWGAAIRVAEDVLLDIKNEEDAKLAYFESLADCPPGGV